MPGWMVGILVALAFVGLVGWLLFSRKKKRDGNDWKKPTFTRGMQIINSTTPVPTPNGHKVYFEPGTDKSTFSLSACDAGVAKTFEKAGCAGYNVDVSRHRISIVVLNSIIAPESGLPAYKIYIPHTSPYYQSEFDMERGKGLEVDHYVLAAGETIATGNPYGDVIAIPHYNGRDAELARIVEYEMEHVLLAWYDGEKYEATKIHGGGAGHPLIADCQPSAVGFASRPFRGLCGGARK